MKATCPACGSSEVLMATYKWSDIWGPLLAAAFFLVFGWIVTHYPMILIGLIILVVTIVRFVLRLYKLLSPEKKMTCLSCNTSFKDIKRD